MSTEELTEGLDPTTQILLGGQPEPESQETETEEPSPNQEADSSAQAEDAPDTTSSDDAEQQETAEPLTVKSLAEKLETSAAKLYESLELDINGEKVSLGALKDHGKDLLQSKVLLAQAQEKSDEVNTQVLDRQQELQLLAQELGIQPTEQQLQSQRDKIKAYRETEDATLEGYVPDFDNDAFQAWLIKQGYTPAERANLHSARLRRDLYQSMQREQRIASALGGEEKPQHKAPKATRKSGTSAAKQALADFKAGKVSQDDAIIAAIAGR